MGAHTIWEILGISITTDKKTIQAAYAQKAKSVHPEEHPEAFMELHDAYEQALHFAKSQQRPTQTTVRETKSKDATSNPAKTTPEQPMYEFAQIFQEVKQEEHKKLTKQCHEVLVEIEALLKQKRVRVDVWNTLLEDPVFQTISKETLFINQLTECLSKYVPLPLHAILSLSIYYQDIQKQEDNQAVDMLAQFLETAYTIREQVDKKHRKHRNRVLLVSLLFLTIGYCILTNSFSLLAIGIPLIIFLYGCFQLTKFKEKQQLTPKRILLLLGSFLLMFICITTLFLEMKPKGYEKAQTWLEEHYHTPFSYVKEISTTRQDTHTYEFYEPTNAISFHVQASKYENDWIFRDDFLDQYIVNLLDDETISPHTTQTTFASSTFSSFNGFTIVIPSLDDIDTIAKTLQSLCETLQESPYYAYFQTYEIYIYPQEIMFPNAIPSVLTCLELEGKSSETIARLLHKYMVYFQLEYTIAEPDRSDPYVQEYFMRASGIDITVGGTDYHFDDIHVNNHRLSLGNFYRLANHLHLDIQVSGPNSFVWNIHGIVELFGSGTRDPYISQAYVETLLNL